MRPTRATEDHFENWILSETGEIRERDNGPPPGCRLIHTLEEAVRFSPLSPEGRGEKD
jgi:hypothetical protein